ncbi:MAG TPA: transglutaminase domain-containing protein [Mucilaginibacter sp.]
MKKTLLSLLSVVLFKTAFTQNTNADSIFLKHVNSIEISTTDFNKLLPLIIQPGKNNQEKLTLVYYWVYQHISFDTERFLKTGPLQPISLSETLGSGKALCYEYNEFIDAACRYLKIPGYNIEGYVKYYGFEAGQSFTQNNHIWYVVNIDGSCKMIDLLWACGTLSIKGDNYTFRKKLHKEFFLVNPENFGNTHLPADPIWQFENQSLKMSGFISKINGIDSTQRNAYVNYADTINKMNKLNTDERELKSAIRAYSFNPENPNQLIIVYYNQAVALVNNVMATKMELTKAKNFFIESKMLITRSKDNDIQSLSPVCEKGIKSIELRLKQVKN